MVHERRKKLHEYGEERTNSRWREEEKTTMKRKLHRRKGKERGRRIKSRWKEAGGSESSSLQVEKTATSHVVGRLNWLGERGTGFAGTRSSTQLMKSGKEEVSG